MVSGATSRDKRSCSSSSAAMFNVIRIMRVAGWPSLGVDSKKGCLDYKRCVGDRTVCIWGAAGRVG